MSGVLVRSAAIRIGAGIGLGFLGLLFLGLAAATGLLTLPIAILLLGLAWWLFTGAVDPPSRVLRWVLGIGGGLTALMLLAVIVILFLHKL